MLFFLNSHSILADIGKNYYICIGIEALIADRLWNSLPSVNMQNCITFLNAMCETALLIRIHNMKKQLLLFLSLIVPTLSFAQLMPDGSVQVVAYWDKGDEFSYKCIDRQERVDDTGKVSLIKSSSEDLIIKVSDQTDSTYTLLLDTKDGFYSDTRVQSYMELLNSLGESSPIQLTTTSMGTVVSYDNLDVLVKETRDMIPKLVDALFKQYDKETRKQMDRKGMIEYFNNTIATPEALTASINEEVEALFMFHGARMDTTSTYTLPTQFSMAGTEPIDANMEFWVDSAETDSTFAVIRTHMHVEGEKFNAAVAKSAGSAASAIVKDESFDLNTATESAFKDLDFKATLDDYSALVIHLPTGWPIRYNYERNVVATAKGSSTQENIYRSIEIITD